MTFPRPGECAVKRGLVSFGLCVVPANESYTLFEPRSSPEVLEAISDAPGDGSYGANNSLLQPAGTNTAILLARELLQP